MWILQLPNTIHVLSITISVYSRHTQVFFVWWLWPNTLCDVYITIEITYVCIVVMRYFISTKKSNALFLNKSV